MPLKKVTKRVHICVIGDVGTGKSALVTSFCTNRSPTRNTSSSSKTEATEPFRKPAKTVAMDYAAKRIPNDEESRSSTSSKQYHQIEVCVTDFSGSDLYQDARYATYDSVGRDVDGFLLVCSKRSAETSFETIETKWFEEIKRADSRRKATRVPSCVCICIHDTENKIENKINEIDGARFSTKDEGNDRSHSLLRERFERLLELRDSDRLRNGPEPASTEVHADDADDGRTKSFVCEANAKTSKGVQEMFVRLAKNALARRERTHRPCSRN